jgi:predicted  nucleic acid-binding Zn-ribbon protein
MSDLYSLYKLHKIDSALYGLKQEAASLDVGQGEQQQMKALAAEYAEVGGRAKALAQETKDLELQQQGYAEKIKGFEKKLYDGSIVSPKEIENVEKEVVMLKGLSEKNDERLFELYNEAPPVIEEAAVVQATIDKLKAAIDAKRARAVERHNEIKVEFDALRSSRPAAAKEVDKDLYDQYEEVRKHTGVAMAEVSEDKRCSLCGIPVPERQSKMLDDDRIVLCEGCHRILFKAVPGS